MEWMWKNWFPKISPRWKLVPSPGSEIPRDDRVHVHHHVVSNYLLRVCLGVSSLFLVHHTSCATNNNNNHTTLHQDQIWPCLISHQPFDVGVAATCLLMLCVHRISGH
jgi:hypothetical protein